MPERRLWFGVLEDAVRVLCRAAAFPEHARVGRFKAEVETVAAWFGSASEEVGSYRWLCDVLDLLAPERFHRALAAYLARWPTRGHHGLLALPRSRMAKR